LREDIISISFKGITLKLDSPQFDMMQKQISEYFDISTFFITLLLLSFGLISIYSATYESGMSDYFYKQLIFTAFGIGIMFITMFLPEHFIFRFSYILYFFCLLLLIAVKIFGKEIAGTRGWFDMGGFSFQPAELAKLATLIAAARFLSIQGTDIKTIRDLGFAFLLFLIPIILISIQPDIGTATVLVALLFGLLFWTGFDLFALYFILFIPLIFILDLKDPIYFIVGAVVFSISAFFFKKKIIITITAIAIISGIGYSSNTLIDKFLPHQKDRIETFLYPGTDPKGKGYNAIQATLAVGSGGVAGKGFLQGLQTQLRFIPEQRTDFIFCVPTEEFGFIGGSFLVLLLIGLILRSIKCASESESKFFSIICFGIGMIFLYHILINIGMVIGLLPVMGIPLPFLSYGGSFLMVNLIMIGLLLNSFRRQRLRRLYH
jgi:rod shape determining protein RodA